LDQKRKNSWITYEAVLSYVGGSRQKYAAFVQDGIRQGFGIPWDGLLAQMVLGDRNFLEKLKRMTNPVIKGSAKDQPSYRMIRNIEAEALLKQAADYFRVSVAELTKKRGQHRQERALVMELLHRYSGLKQRIIGEWFGGLDEGLVSRDRKAIRQEINTEPRIRKWFNDLEDLLGTQVKI
jgi:cell division protein ZapA (FtsZ GTPase activity inhibitor)